VLSHLKKKNCALGDEMRAKTAELNKSKHRVETFQTTAHKSDERAKAVNEELRLTQEKVPWRAADCSGPLRTSDPVL